MSIDSFYFSHDFNSRNDEKMIRLLKDEKWEGYGIYWAIVEKMHESGGWLEFDCESIAFDLRTDKELISRLLNREDLFRKENGRVTSDRVLSNIAKRLEKSHKARESAQLSWINRDINKANAKRTQSDGNAIKERKGKERKIKESKSNDVFTPPLFDQVNEYCQERLNGIDPQAFIDFYQARGWKFKTGQPVKDWKACVRTWEARNNKPVSLLTDTQKRNIAKFNKFTEDHRLKGDINGL